MIENFLSKITEQELREIKKLQNRLKEQDPRGTALPIWFLLQDVIEEFDPVNDGEYYIYCDSDACETYRGNTPEEILKDMNLEDDEDKEKLLSDIEDNCYPAKTKYETQRIFITEKAANDHLKANYYHYTSKARIYVDHAWRNPEMELIYKMILSYPLPSKIKTEL